MSDHRSYTVPGMDAETKRIREEKRKEAKRCVEQRGGFYYCEWEGCRDPEVGKLENAAIRHVLLKHLHDFSLHWYCNYCDRHSMTREEVVKHQDDLHKNLTSRTHKCEDCRVISYTHLIELDHHKISACPERTGHPEYRLSGRRWFAELEPHRYRYTHVYYRLVPLLEGDHREMDAYSSSSEAALLDERDVPKHRYFKDEDERPRRPEYDPKLPTKDDIQDHHLRKVLNFRSLPKCQAAVSYRKFGIYGDIGNSYF